MTRRPSFSPWARHLSRAAGGVLAMVPPVLASVPAVRSVLAGDADLAADATASLLSGLLFLLAAPTAWLFTLLDLSPGLTLVLSAATSLPLWFALGARLATRSRRWLDWWGRYLTAVLVWSGGFLLVLAAIATLTG